MRTRFAFALVAGLALSAAALAQDTPPAANADAAKQQAEATMQGAAAMLNQANPKAIAVPDGPVVNKAEVEGILIEDLKIGEGYEVKPGGAVVALYHGTLKADPTKVFDSAFERGEPVAFPLSGVIPGWQKGVPGMKVGGIRRLTIPAALAYGAQSPSPDIPANSDLVFVIQLIDALQIEDVKVGEGELVASNQCVPVTAHTITGADGKVIEKIEATNPYIWFPGEWQPISFGVEGMKRGGKRKITVPKEMNQGNPALPSDRPTGVAVTIELELLALRNLPTRGR